MSSYHYIINDQKRHKISKSTRGLCKDVIVIRSCLRAAVLYCSCPGSFSKAVSTLCFIVYFCFGVATLLCSLLFLFRTPTVKLSFTCPFVAQFLLPSSQLQLCLLYCPASLPSPYVDFSIYTPPSQFFLSMVLSLSLVIMVQITGSREAPHLGRGGNQALQAGLCKQGRQSPAADRTQRKAAVSKSHTNLTG